jgi:type VI secretion system secreted protein VgrG
MFIPLPRARPDSTGDHHSKLITSASALARPSALGAALWLACLQPAAAASLLNSAQDFAVLGATTVTSAAGGSQIYGDLGVSPNTSITGFPPGVVSNGSIRSAGAVSSAAQADAAVAYNTLGVPGPIPLIDLTGKSLGTLGSPGFATLMPGTYNFDTSAAVNGLLTLDFGANPTGSFVFLIGSTLVTASGASVSVLNGGEFSSIYWRVGSSATLGSGTLFAGNILANTSISMNDDAQILGGRAIALNGAVTMIGGGVSRDCIFGGCSAADSDFGSNGFSGQTSAVPEPTSMLMFALGALALRWVRVKERKAPAAEV